MARNKSPLQIKLEYYPLRAFWGILKALPLPIGERICHVLLKVLLLILPKRREIMLANLKACFSERPAEEREKWAEQSIRYLSRALALYPRIPELVKSGMDAYVQSEGLEYLNEAVKKGRGAICFTAHYGFWEMMAIHVTRFYPVISMIVRPLDNPLLDALVSSVRSSGGGGVIPHRRALKDSIVALRKNGVLGILIDQNFYKGGVFVDFFGRLAATTSIVSLFARRTGCAVLPMHNVWEGGKIRIICEPPITLSSHPDPDQAIAEDTQLMTKFVEKWIRQDPAQWLWLHNRWKRKPEPGDFVFAPSSDVNDISRMVQRQE